MFNKAVTSATLTSEAADRLFSNITASSVPDRSFTATLRALLRKRLPQEKVVRLLCREIRFSANDISNAPTSQCMGWFIPESVRYPVECEYNIFIVYSTQAEAGAKMLEVVRANAGKGRRHMSNYIRHEDLRIFYARKIDALFYTDNNRNAIIFAAQLELKHFHVLQMMIPKYLPSLFADSPLTEFETALLKSTGNKTADEYEALIGEFAKDLDIRSEIIRTKLAGFETAFERIRIDEIKVEITDYQNSYNANLSILRDLSQKIQNCQYTLAGLECAVNRNSDDSEMMEYFMCNKNLLIIMVTGTAIEFVVQGYADVYDAEAFERYVENYDGYMYSKLNPAVTKHQMEKLYRAIFSENLYKLRICAAYSADMRTGLRARQYYIFPPESCTYLPNTHIQQFGCVGTYAARFQEYMQKKDYVGAIEQAVVSARNLNFYDSTVMTAFAGELSYTAIKCIEKSDGTLLTVQEAIKEAEGDEICRDQ